MQMNKETMLNALLSIILGLLVGIFFHYLLYRFSLPREPFIYANF